MAVEDADASEAMSVEAQLSSGAVAGPGFGAAWLFMLPEARDRSSQATGLHAS